MKDHFAPIPSIEPDLMSLQEYAARAGIGLTKAYEDARQDHLLVPVFKSGRRFFVSRRAFDALLTRQHGDTRPEAA